MPACAQPRFEPCGALAFIHRFCSSLNAHLQFHCVVIDGVFDPATTGGVIFSATTGVDANACPGAATLPSAPARKCHYKRAEQSVASCHRKSALDPCHRPPPHSGSRG